MAGLQGEGHWNKGSAVYQQLAKDHMNISKGNCNNVLGEDETEIYVFSLREKSAVWRKQNAALEYYTKYWPSI